MSSEKIAQNETRTDWIKFYRELYEDSANQATTAGMFDIPSKAPETQGELIVLMNRFSNWHATLNSPLHRSNDVQRTLRFMGILEVLVGLLNSIERVEFRGGSYT